MKNPNEVLRMKEQEILRIKIEIEALRVTARLLSDENSAGAAAAASGTSGNWSKCPRRAPPAPREGRSNPDRGRPMLRAAQLATPRPMLFARILFPGVCILRAGCPERVQSTH